MSENIEAFPLSWPITWPRTKHPERSRFKVTPGKARDEIFSELRKLGASNVILSSDIALRNDGLPYANRLAPQDKGVAVYFTHKGEQKCIPCDRWDRTQDNMWAIAKSIDALRGLGRWGASHTVDVAFQSFAQLPLPVKSWRRVFSLFGLQPDFDKVKSRYKELCLKHHPDKPEGSNEKMAEINKAYQEAKEELL